MRRGSRNKFRILAVVDVLTGRWKYVVGKKTSRAEQRLELKSITFENFEGIFGSNGERKFPASRVSAQLDYSFNLSIKQIMPSIQCLLHI